MAGEKRVEMESLIAWVESVERSAAELYRAASHYFRDEAEFSLLLAKLAEEELWHAQLIATAEGTPEEFAVVPDPDTRANIEGLFAQARSRLARGSMTREGMYAAIAAIEFSEWNEFFLYALGLLRGGGEEFRLAVGEIERHKEQIIGFFRTLADGDRYLAALRALPTATGKRILVIETRPGLALLLRSALAPIGEVHLEETGPDGLARLQAEHFDVILSDIDMGAMDSLDFYQRVVNLDPGLSGRFIFFVGSRAEAAAAQLAATGPVELLSKPSLLGQICRAVAGIAHGERILH